MFFFFSSALFFLVALFLDGVTASISERDIYASPGIRLRKVSRDSQMELLPHSSQGISIRNLQDAVYVGEITVGPKGMFSVTIDTAES